METQISEADWKRFNRGEKGVFVRKLQGFREKAKLAAINQRRQEDAEFRDYVNRYLAQFGVLLEKAEETRPRRRSQHDFPVIRHG
jgi:hypothetical protein